MAGDGSVRVEAAWFTPARLLLLFCLMSLLVYLDRGTMSSAAVSGNPGGDAPDAPQDHTILTRPRPAGGPRPPPEDDPPPRRDGRPPRQDGGSAPVSRRSSDAYSGEPASTEAADPRDEGTVRGDPDVEKLAPP